MTGLEKIISQIEEDARSQEQEILSQAEADAKAVLEDAERSCGQIREDGAAKAEAASQDILAKSRSAARMQRKQRLLTARQEVIGEILDKAQEALYSLSDEEYFALIVRMVERFAEKGAGQIRLNERDLGRLPAGFEQAAGEAAAKKGGSLALSKEPCGIRGGFLLVYGGIEENCSFEAIFAAEREALQDKVHTFLFT